MLPYFLVFFLTALPVIIQTPKAYYGFLGIISVLYIGLRFEVGTDWYSYLQIFEYSKRAPWINLEGAFTDFGYHILNKLAAFLGQDIYFVNTAVAVIFTIGLFKFCNKLKDPYLGLVIAFPYLTTVVAMNATRQIAAIGVEMLALPALAKGKIGQFLCLIFLAALFHKTAAILLIFPLALFILQSLETGKLLYAAGASAFLIPIILITNFLLEKFTSYFETQMSSSGALIRLIMNLLPATVFLLEYYTGDNFFTRAPKIYLALAWLAILSFLLLLTGSTTVADRLGLYLTPIQVYVLGNFPYLFLSQAPRAVHFWRLTLVGYSLAVLWIWLNFADHAFEWIPYRIYPFV